MDAKSLLRARKATARVEHPHAAYTAAGQLRCAICAVPVNQWDAHLLTKQHRQSAAREKAQAAKAAKRRGGGERDESAKRARVENGSEDEGGDDDDAGPSLPAGFFSAGNKPSVDDEEAAPEAAPAPAPAVPEPTGDAELDDFLASLNDDDEAPAPAAPAPAPAAPTRRKGLAYKKTEDAPGVASYAAAPVLLAANGDAAEAEPEEPEESEAERRARVEREEREEIVARLEDEQRAQEDADSRVVALKARMEALKKRRAGKKA
ncbi:hypothetical protein Q8F55_000313 [Vanrija albida]|uniref:Zinc finger protein 830 n=1 Tax=Vanrija albida TaxID=181172 RepID=A0ABR3QCX0_9TREE